jgi:hypothetical protein
MNEKPGLIRPGRNTLTQASILLALSSAVDAQTGPWSDHVIAPSTAGSLATADFDGDGDPDLVDGELWHENLGSGASWAAHSHGLASADDAVDLDGDGDVDLVGTRSSNAIHELSWSENVAGDGSNMVAHAIAALAGGSLPLGSRAADLDGDGDLDVLVLDAAGQLAWQENALGDASIWLGHELAPGPLQSFDVGDLDGDGDPDVLTGGASEYSWHENALGDGSSWVARSIHRATSFTRRGVRATDIDGDGALDALFSTHQGSSTGPYRMGWLRNMGGGGAWVLNVVRAEASAPLSLVPTVIGADLDRDGDTDLVEFLAQRTVWYEQVAGAWSRRVPPGLAWNVEAVLDVDVDGDRDLVGRNGDLHWRENLTAVTPYGSDVNPPRSLTLVAGAPAIGQTLTFGVDNPLGTQASGARTLMNVALAPEEEFPGGDLLPGWGMAGRGAAGELLLSYSKGNPVLSLVGPAWSGPGIPALIPVAVPADPLLIGVRVYVQGVMVDPSGAFGVKLGLTNALRLELGN